MRTGNINPLAGCTRASLEERFRGCHITEIDVDGHTYFIIGIHAPTEASIERARTHFRQTMHYHPGDNGLTEEEGALLEEMERVEHDPLNGSFFKNAACSNLSFFDSSFFRKAARSSYPEVRRASHL